MTIIVLIDSFVLALINRVFRPCTSCVASFVEKILRVFRHFRIVVDFGNKKIKLEKSVGLKMVIF